MPERELEALLNIVTLVHGIYESKSIKKNSVILSPLLNYTDRAIAAGQRS
jgi:hypothetical protein